MNLLAWPIGILFYLVLEDWVPLVGTVITFGAGFGLAAFLFL